jgi:hypothetical protein
MIHISIWFMLMMFMYWLEACIPTIKKNTEALAVAYKEIGLEENADKTKYMVMTGVQNAG